MSLDTFKVVLTFLFCFIVLLQVKPISAADERTLDCAIALANELAAKSMNDLGVNSDRSPSAPISPASPNKRKFSFRFPSTMPSSMTANKQHTRPEGKTFTDEAASIPDIQVS